MPDDTPSLKHALNLWLKPIPHVLREYAHAALESGDVTGFLCAAENEHSLELVYFNRKILIQMGLYEVGLLHAFIATRTNNFKWPLHELRYMFATADRSRLRAAGEPLPGPGPFTIFRGVSGIGPARRVRGVSWTTSEEKARWFALRHSLPNPDVFRATVNEADVLAYTDDRSEQEFLVLLAEGNKPVRLPRVGVSITRMSLENQ
jgi:hypothetical protein